MNDPELELFEKELRRLRPAEPPDGLVTRLESVAINRLADPGVEPVAAGATMRELIGRWFLRLSLASAVLVAGLLVVVIFRARVSSEPRTGPESAVQVAESHPLPPPRPSSDALEIDRKLLASYEAVAELPERGPVVFRCDQWEDKVTFRDRARGILIERRTPRLEVVPVRFDSY